MKKPKASEKRPGLWEAKGIDPTTGLRKSFYGKTPDLASKKAWASYGIVEDDTLGAYYISVYLPSIARKSLNWRRQVSWAWDKYIKPKFQHTPLSELKRSDLQKLYNGLTKLNPSSVAKVKIVLSGILNLAVEDELIERNPNTKTRLPQAMPKETPSLSAYDLMRLVNECHERVRPFVVLAGLCGLRKGEALGVTWHAINNGWMEVRQQVRVKPGQGFEVTPELKTPQSLRKIPVPFLHLLDCNQVSDIWVCSDSIGGYLTPKNVVRELNEALERLELHVTPHGLRHSFISILENELECPDSIAAALSGRAKRGQNATYSHAKPAQLERWMQKFWDHVSTASTTKFVVQEVQNAGSI